MCLSMIADIIIVVIDVLVREKFFKAYYGFRVLYVFPFPSAGHWPIGSGCDSNSSWNERLSFNLRVTMLF